ncbi:phytanoyl-CoA dioxygenase family protein, partial [Singulisphaera rosea]
MSPLDWGRSLEQDGYAIVPDVIDPDLVEVLGEAIDAIRPGSMAMDRGGRVYALRDLLREVPSTRTLANSEPVLDLARRVLGPKAFVVRGLLFDKTPEANWLVPWHQDLTIAVERRTDAPGYGPWTVKGGIPHVRPPIEVLERMVTLRVQLDDSDLALGPLRVIPGSHF